MKKTILTALIAFGFSNLHAQEESKSPFTFSGYVDVYYSYDFGKPENHIKPGFFYNYNRSNEVNLNLGLAKVNYSKGNVRANLALMAGTYAQYNMSAEQDLLQNKFTGQSNEEAIKYLSFSVEKDFYVVTSSQDTIPCNGVIYERAFKVTPYQKILLFFSGIKPEDKIQLVYKDYLFNKGIMKFKFKDPYTQIKL